MCHVQHVGCYVVVKDAAMFPLVLSSLSREASEFGIGRSVRQLSGVLGGSGHGRVVDDGRGSTPTDWGVSRMLSE